MPGLFSHARTRVLSRAELDSAEVLRAFADAEVDYDAAQGYRRMADRESEHARRWALRLYETHGRMPDRSPSWLAKVLMTSVRRFGIGAVAPIVRRLRRFHHAVARHA